MLSDSLHDARAEQMGLCTLQSVCVELYRLRPIMLHWFFLFTSMLSVRMGSAMLSRVSSCLIRRIASVGGAALGHDTWLDPRSRRISILVLLPILLSSARPCGSDIHFDI